MLKLYHAGKISHDELLTCVAFLKWQKKSFTIIKDADYVMRKTSGKPEVILDLPEQGISYFGFKGIYQYFENNGLFLC